MSSLTNGGPVHRPVFRLGKGTFLLWFNGHQEPDPVVKAGLAHLWFVTIYSLSAQVQRERKDYYDMVQRTQQGTLDVTGWLEWFLGCLLRAMREAEGTLSVVPAKARFWQRWAGSSFNDRQVMLLNRLLHGFDGKLTSSKWAAIAGCSPDSALRDITNLVDRGVLAKSQAGGRSTSYELKPLD